MSENNENNENNGDWKVNRREDSTRDMFTLEVKITELINDHLGGELTQTKYLLAGRALNLAILHNQESLVHDDSTLRSNLFLSRMLDEAYKDAEEEEIDDLIDEIDDLKTKGAELQDKLDELRGDK